MKKRTNLTSHTSWERGQLDKSQWIILGAVDRPRPVSIQYEAVQHGRHCRFVCTLVFVQCSGI